MPGITEVRVFWPRGHTTHTHACLRPFTTETDRQTDREGGSTLLSAFLEVHSSWKLALSIIICMALAPRAGAKHGPRGLNWPAASPSVRRRRRRRGKRRRRATEHRTKLRHKIHISALATRRAGRNPSLARPLFLCAFHEYHLCCC